MTIEELKDVIAGGETLTVEFKSDLKRLPVLEHIDLHKTISLTQVVDLCGISRADAKKLLRKLCGTGDIVLLCKGRWAKYGKRMKKSNGI